MHRLAVLLAPFLFAAPWTLAEQAASLPARPEAQAANRQFLAHIAIQGTTLMVRPGVYRIAGRELRIEQAASLAIEPADLVAVENEPLKLSPDRPNAWAAGTPLRGVRTAGVNASGSLAPGSLVIRKSPGGEPLTEGKDYLVGTEFGMVGIGPESRVSPNDTVFASYRCSLRRIDSVFIDTLGRPSLIRGRPDISVPVPPEPAWSGQRLFNVYRPYHAQELTDEHLFPLLEAPDLAVTRSAPGRLPKALQKIKAGKPLTIVCWGDSVTTGGDVSRGSMRYVEQFRRMLIDGLPNPCLPVNVVNISYGGTTSRQWLRMEPFTDEWFRNPGACPADEVTFERIIALKPDVLTMEFVNDASMDEAAVEQTYNEILKRVRPFGTELVLITPHFTAAHWMGFRSLREDENRGYVQALYRFAEKHNLAVADASARWAHLWKEGVPYPTLLVNTLNHPDDRGHRLFAEEMIKCFR
ncbi:MAG: SGNH/GDSL hydrolase family protein [Phycisphaerae bacterium]|nr:SGNH/GDSL hydrolase family protein [Phycisphaerae bacterium]